LEQREKEEKRILNKEKKRKKRKRGILDKEEKRGI
jgi:hypothetical protein